MDLCSVAWHLKMRSRCNDGVTVLAATPDDGEGSDDVVSTVEISRHVTDSSEAVYWFPLGRVLLIYSMIRKVHAKDCVL